MLGANEVLDLLAQLKALLQEFSARASKLEQDFRVRAAAENRVKENAAAEQLQQHSLRVADTELAFENEKVKWETIFDNRRVRINEVHKMLRRSAVEDVSTHEGRRKHKLQQAAMEAERRRDANLAAADTAHADFKDNLAQSANTYATLEVEAAKTFRGLRLR